MPTSKQDSDFADVVKEDSEVSISDYALDNAIAWIAKNLNPADVFSDSDLENWAENNGYVKETI